MRVEPGAVLSACGRGFVNSIDFGSCKDMFYFISDLVGLPVDQVNYFMCFLLSFPLALTLREYLSYKTTSVSIRNGFCTIFGILFCLVCFQLGATILILFATLAYCMLVSLKRDVVQWYTLVYCYVFVCTYHIYRMVVNYGQYTLDLSFPLMIMMQRVTYVAFSYHDGGKREKDLNDDQRINKIVQKPSIVEYLSYVFSFYSVLTGPSATYMEHNNMITGQNFQLIDSTGSRRGEIPFNSSYNTVVVLRKAGVGAVCLVISLMGSSLDKVVLDPSFSLPQRIVYVAVFCFTLRCKYYFVWMTIESVSNLAGLGYNGHDEVYNTPKWDLVSNIAIYDYEFGSYYERILLFNRLTALWLKRIAFQRFDNVWVTYAMSALWHGFYPGYYLFYVVILSGLEASKRINRNIGPYLESSAMLQTVYSVISFLARTIIFDFCQLSFFFLVHDKVFIAWKYYHFFPFLLSVIIIFVFPKRKKQKKEE